MNEVEWLWVSTQTCLQLIAGIFGIRESSELVFSALYHLTPFVFPFYFNLRKGKQDTTHLCWRWLRLFSQRCTRWENSSSELEVIIAVRQMTTGIYAYNNKLMWHRLWSVSTRTRDERNNKAFVLIYFKYFSLNQMHLHVCEEFWALIDLCSFTTFASFFSSEFTYLKCLTFIYTQPCFTFMDSLPSDLLNITVFYYRDFRLCQLRVTSALLKSTTTALAVNRHRFTFPTHTLTASSGIQTNYFEAKPTNVTAHERKSQCCRALCKNITHMQIALMRSHIGLCLILYHDSLILWNRRALCKPHSLLRQAPLLHTNVMLPHCLSVIAISLLSPCGYLTCQSSESAPADLY